MVNGDIQQVALWAALAAMVPGGVAEWLHVRRMRRLGRLAFGPRGGPRMWVAGVPVLRVAALGLLVWGLVVLLSIDGGLRGGGRDVAATRHLVVMMDVSPSMGLADAGSERVLPRRARAAEVLRSVMERANADRVRVTLVCFYTDAMMVAKECADRELIWNFAEQVPLHMAYRPGKTSILQSLNTTGGLIKDFPRKSVTLLMLTDGDAVPASGLTPLPSSVAKLVVAGVGDAGKGTYIDGHMSRQDSASLAQLARRLGGDYFDGNTRQVPSVLLRHLMAEEGDGGRFRVDLRMWAVGAVAAGAGMLCLLPLVLALAGSGWKPAAVGRRAAA